MSNIIWKLDPPAASNNNATRNAVNRTQTRTCYDHGANLSQTTSWSIDQSNQPSRLVNFNIPLLFTFWARRKLNPLPKHPRNPPQKHTKSIPDISTRKNRDRIRLPRTVPNQTQTRTR